ncbi:MAG: hypothetical protein ABR548_09815 [Actinomycetota bacterium]|nr:hypothetical protein [Actinomycetota bacterium]
MADEEIVERRERRIHRATDRLGAISPRVRAVVLRSAPFVAGLALVVAATTGHHKVETITFAPSLSPSASPASITTAPPSAESTETPATVIDGTGPFLLFAQNEPGAADTAVRIFMLDLSIAVTRQGAQPTDETLEPTLLTTIDGSAEPQRQMQFGGSAVALVSDRGPGDTAPYSRLWVFRRGSVPERPLIDDGITIFAAVPNPDGKSVALLKDDLLREGAGTLWLQSLSGAGATPIMEVTTPPDEIGRPLPAAWSGKDLLAFPSCDCDAGFVTSYYLLSLTRRRMTRAPWLGPPDLDRGEAVSGDGKTIVMARATRKPGCDARESDCSKPPTRLLVASAGSHSFHEIARAYELSFDAIAVSPTGKLVAYATGRGGEIVVRRLSNGGVVGAVQDRIFDFVPLAWISENSFVATGTLRDTESNEQTLLYLVTARDDGGFDLQRIFMLDNSTQLLGWLR